MIPEFKSLNPEEAQLMLDAPALLTILIAGVEGEIDNKEKDWAVRIAQFRARDRHSIMQNYYEEVSGHFNETLESLLKTLPKDTEERSKYIINELKKINNIIPKLDKKFASEFYKGYLAFRVQVAKASGGLWGYGSISREEQKIIDMEILKPPKED
ncbi:MAG: hypothetical protein HGGPFJEG_00048 [Ignavibacteria bacterium]|nr:hypothetical protein [Ignavibacteria bacterium]